MVSQTRAAFVVFLLLTLFTGTVYPALVTAVAQALFRHEANGSLLEKHGTPIGSELIGQHFDDPRFFWGRPSATSPVPCNAAASTGSNLGPTNPALMAAVADRVKHIRDANPDRHGPIPADLVTASASGLDPHISPAAADFQVPRVAKARGVQDADVRTLVAKFTEGRTLGFVGEPRVNVLKLNLALDELRLVRFRR